jgi:AraC family transcriptional regulator
MQLSFGSHICAENERTRESINCKLSYGEDKSMEWIERLNATINYMEEHLTDDIEIDELARIACCSAYHYQRMFTYMSGMPLSEYIRRRKMSLAAVELQRPDTKIIDIALKYGYNSPTAFNRAFQNIHGIAPSMLKKEGVSIKAFPPLTFKITIKGVEQMNYRIETKEAFKIVGVSKPLYKDLGKNFEIVPAMWQSAVMDGTLPKLAAMMNTKMQGLLGVSACSNEEQWKYFIAVASTASSEEFEEYMVPAATWAIFEGTGDNTSIQKLEQRIITEWLPTSGYEYDNAPDIEVYLNPDPQNATYEVWIPVKRK